MSLISELTSLLKDRGAQLVGVGDLSSIQLNPGSEAAVPAGGDGRNTALLTEAFKTMKTGVSVALPVPASIVEDLKTALTLEYYHAYNAMNKQLNEIVLAGERFLQEQGYHAHAQTTDRVTGTADKGSSITITVSTGSAKTDVPSVVGWSESEATSELRNSGFAVSVSEQSSSSVAAGVVISQTPSGGSSAASGTTVTITVSTGPASDNGGGNGGGGNGGADSTDDGQ